MSRIQQLDSQIANMIAAGEVVERPMGVIKELVENSLDADSTRIVITIEGGGIQKLKVEDNGCGMDKEDALKAFGRHATSKIRQQNDLWHIGTLGFRGEALPSIASVSKLTLVTSDGNDATKVVMEYGENTLYTPQACPEGTSITVEGLFYRTPARLKHLRSANYEANLIQNLVCSFALSRPDVAFRLIHENREIFRSTGNNNLHEVIFQVFGRGAAENAVALDFSDLDYHVTGYAIKPLINRSNRNQMHVFLNRRMVRDYKLYQAIQEGYRSYLPQGRYPIVVINIDMDPHILDVNVHPSKWEVRLSKQTQLEYLLQDQIAKALQDTNLIKEVKEKPIVTTYYQPLAFEKEDLRPEPKREEEKPVVKEQPVVIQEEVVEIPLPVQEEIAKDNEVLQEIYQKPNRVEEKEETYDAVPAFPDIRLIGQFHQSYLLAEAENGLVLIHQRRASMRIAYEAMLQKQKEDTTMQQLLVPLTFHVPSTLVNRVEELNEAVAQLSVSFEPFGADTLLVREVPSWLMGMEEKDVLQDLLDYFQVEKRMTLDEVARKQIAMKASSHAVSQHTYLSQEQMEALLQQLRACQNPFITPQGKPILVMMDEKVLLKEFGQ